LLIRYTYEVNISIAPLFRPKQKILGRKTKNDVGKPGVARAKAIQKVC